MNYWNTFIPDLIASCILAKSNAYSFYSDFRVGAAVLTKNGKVFTGASVDNSIYGLSICAERSAILKVSYYK